MLTGRIARFASLFLSVLAAAAVLAAPASAGTAGRGVAGRGVAGIGAWRVAGARQLGALAVRPMRVTFVLAPRHAAALRALVSTAHPALTRSQFNARYAPTQSAVTRLRRWAELSGLRIGSVSANRMLVSVSGSSSQLARALHTQFARYSSIADGSFFATTRAARLPAALAGQVRAVMGLSSLGKVSVTHPARRSSSGLAHVLATPKLGALAVPSLNYPAQYGPQDLWSLYNAPASQTGSGQQLAIITEGDLSQPKKDLATFEQHFGLPTVTWNQINVGTGSSDTSGSGEWDLDSQYSTGFAPGVSQLNVYVGSSLSNQDILATINRWVTDNTSKQGSFSAGECDLLASVSGFTSGLDAVLQQAAAQGQTMFFSSGDTGSQCPAIVGVNGVPAGIPDTNYPASSPYGIGVGGTSVLGSGPTEIAWYAGGGGLSPIEPTPSFQSATKLLGAVPLAQRGVPDVSLNADPESGYEVVVGGTVQTIGGTSASAPSWQGIWARAQGAHGGALGFAGPVLYGTEPATAFHDITLGGNGLYVAHPGYDLVTGLGTPDITQLVNGA
jgi:pseudomonalisin